MGLQRLHVGQFLPGESHCHRGGLKHMNPGLLSLLENVPERLHIIHRRLRIRHAYNRRETAFCRSGSAGMNIFFIRKPRIDQYILSEDNGVDKAYSEIEESLGVKPLKMAYLPFEMELITRYVGDAVCLVAADTPEILEEAKKLVKIEYEELPGVFSPQEALKPDAPLVHETGNVLAHEHLVRGDAKKAIENSKYVVTKEYRTPFTEHAFLEPECSVAIVDREKEEALIDLLNDWSFISICIFQSFIFQSINF